MGTWKVLLLSAARSVVNHRMKSLIVGFIMMLGTALLVLGTAMLDSVEKSMKKTVTSSLAGDMQVYSANAEDQLALFGEAVFGGDDVGEMEDFAEVRKTIESVDNVQAVVPMGITQARFVMGNRIDEVLEELRQAVNSEDWERAEELEKQVRSMADNLEKQNANRAAIASDPEPFEERVEVLQTVQDDQFWDERLRENPVETMQFLDTQIAPLASDGNLVFLRLLGTDPARFREHFDRFQVEKGQRIPDGKRGVMISNRSYEEWLKNRVAREFDRLDEEIEEQRDSRILGGTALEDVFYDGVIAEDDVLQHQIERLQKQYQRITFGLPPEEAAEIERRVRDYLGKQDGTRKEVLQAFLALDDENFDERYDFFYAEIAPLMKLYEFDVGETVTLQAFSDRGFTRSANVKIWGTYSFKGLEDSDLAGSVSLVDLMTFRRLYGVISEEEREELEKIRQEAGVEDVGRDDAEDALFGGGDSLVVEGEESEAESDPLADIRAARAESDALDGTYTQEDIDNGPARNAAIILEDPEKLAETQAEVEAAISEADLELTVLDWQTAAGIVGQFVTVVRLVLYIAIGIIFLVALVIINNSMVMATVERTDEIGTMRAIGAKRWYVMMLFLLETMVLGLSAGLAGCGLGALSVFVLGQTGVPATTDFLRFLFAGDVLYPTLSVYNILIAFAVIVFVSAVSTYYPARLATRVQPVVAMRGN
jgi:ABC-type lipoprotein release transport system permease subunit